MDELQSLRRKSVPLYVELATILRNRIMNGSLPPGAKVPTLKVLTEELGVSRVTARQAMDLLESEGLIERGSGRGTFVKMRPQLETEQLELTARLDSLTSMVRGGAAEIISSVPSRDLLDNGVDGVSASALQNDFTYFRRVHSKDGLPFSLVDVFLRKDIYDSAPEDFRTRIAVEVFAEIGIEIASADQYIDISSASLEDARLLKQEVNSPIADVKRVFRDSAGDVFYAARIKYPSSFISFHIKFQA